MVTPTDGVPAGIMGGPLPDPTRRVVHVHRRRQELHNAAAQALADAAAAHLVKDSFITAGVLHEALTVFTAARKALDG